MTLIPAAWRTTAMAVSCALLAACATTPPAPVEEALPPSAQAALMERSGDDVGAAAAWEQAARATTGAPSRSYLLNAADAWLRSGDRRRAFDLLTEIEGPGLSSDEQSRLRLLQAERALSEGDVATVRKLLAGMDTVANSHLDGRLQDLASRVRQIETGAGSDLLRRIGADVDAAGPFALTQAVDLLARYEFAPSGTLSEVAALSDLNPGAASWAALMVRIRTAVLDEDRLSAAADAWSRDFPEHPVGSEEFSEIAFLYALRFPAPRRVAVLLPADGGLAAAGAAIRDGLLSAFLARPELGELRFYPAGERVEEVLASYRQAWADGADWVIGPLRQSSVQAIAELGLENAPTLALNDLSHPESTILPADFHTLSLSQETEAATIAREMRAAGIERVITLTTDSAWGSRMEVAFVNAFIAAGGQVIDVARFDTAGSDHSAELTRLLRIDDSRQRKDRLQSLLGLPLSFEPRLRDDFDAFFMSSAPEQARQIRPQLRFFDAGDKPLFAASRVYSGISDPAADRDLNGILLPLSHLQLQAATAPDLPRFDSIRGGSLLNLHALGADAWRLLKWMPLLRSDPDLRFPGASGALSPLPGGVVERRPAWARFEDGRPVPFALEPAPGT